MRLMGKGQSKAPKAMVIPSLSKGLTGTAIL